MKNSFCLYRLPNHEKVYFLEGTAAPMQGVQNPDIGFVFAPFFGHLDAFILPGRAVEYSNELIHTKVDLFDSTMHSVSKESYLNYSNLAIDTLKNSDLDKIVMARNLVIGKPDGFDFVGFFDKMCSAYPQAFVYSWYSAYTGMWMGATPEVLIENKANSGTTMALAGTRTKAQFYDFSEKEIEEQQWVYRFIQERLTALGCHNIQKEELESFGAGNLVHLMNRITFEIDEIPQRWKILQGIHPTPAVAGYPQLEALDFIKKHELFNRKYYSGYLGPFTSNRMNIFVNLRCMQVHQNKLELFAGAGITASSSAEHEYLETDEKLKTLLQLLQ